jgi:hypothetical protein
MFEWIRRVRKQGEKKRAILKELAEQRVLAMPVYAVLRDRWTPRPQPQHRNHKGR